MQIFLLKIVQMFLVNKNFANIFGPKFCKYFWSKIVQIILVKNCANIFGKKLCKYFWSKILQIILVKLCKATGEPTENQRAKEHFA